MRDTMVYGVFYILFLACFICEVADCMSAFMVRAVCHD